MEMVVQFTEDEIKDIIREKLSNEGLDVDTIKINLDSRWTGYGSSERQETVFKSIEVKVNTKQKSKPEKVYQQDSQQYYFNR